MSGNRAAVQEFRERIPELARSVEQTIEDERTRNQRFAAAFDAFHDICRAGAHRRHPQDVLAGTSRTSRPGARRGAAHRLLKKA